VRDSRLCKAPLIAMAIFTLVVASACGSDDSVDETPTSGATAIATAGTPDAAVEGEVIIYAASSLTSAFEDIATAFEAENAGMDVSLNFGGSPALRAQLHEGARADVYAPADTNNMQQALEADLVADEGDTFTRNRLAVIVPADNPAGITALQDLANEGLNLVLAAEDVPVGRYSRESIAKMQADGSFGEDFESRVLSSVVSSEPNVKAVVTKVQLGEADAGIVYVTDVTAEIAGDVTVIDIPDEFNVIATYPIASTSEAENPAAAEAFIAFVLSDAGQAILAEYGFQPLE
jgi:molybdate transport system substrate-binding protein